MRAAAAFGGDLRDQIALNRAEAGFSISAKDLGNRTACASGDARVAIDQAPSEPPGDRARNGALAGGHEAREDQLRRHGGLVSRVINLLTSIQHGPAPGERSG